MGFRPKETTAAAAAFLVACIWARLNCCLSFLCAFWWPPRACELANPRQQYWHSYFLLSPPEEEEATAEEAEAGKEEESGEPPEEEEEGMTLVIDSAVNNSSSSETLKPKSFKRVVVELGFV
uniref:Uncharacterized protein n=1 Tax=Rhizophora mucronata TaxID=61149 RepID=A0A2P2MZ52_RHIMU